MDIHYQVYILENQSGKRYIGLSEDITFRLNQHNTGESKWTAKFRPWKNETKQIPSLPSANFDSID